MLSPEDAEKFLHNVLRFKDWKDVLSQGKLQFLKKLVPYFAHRLAFNNVLMSATPPEERRVPIETEIIWDCLAGLGGACIVQNTFLTLLLQALGFDAYITSGFVHGSENHPDNHVICAVNFSAEEKYLLDLGVGLPFAEPIAMHQLPQTYVSAGARYKYKKAEDKADVFYRVQMDGALRGKEYDDKDFEYVRYEYTMTPQSNTLFQATLRSVFTDADTSIFLQLPFMFRYFEEDNSGNLVDEANVDGDRKWILIFGVSVIIATDKTKEVKNYETYDEVKPVIKKHFPQFPTEKLEAAFLAWNECASKAGSFKSA